MKFHDHAKQFSNPRNRCTELIQKTQWTKNGTIGGVFFLIPILVEDVHSWKITCPPKKGLNTSSNHWFSGDYPLVFGGVPGVPIFFTWAYRSKRLTVPWHLDHLQGLPFDILWNMRPWSLLKMAKFRCKPQWSWNQDVPTKSADFFNLFIFLSREPFFELHDFHGFLVEPLQENTFALHTFTQICCWRWTSRTASGYPHMLENRSFTRLYLVVSAPPETPIKRY